MYHDKLPAAVPGARHAAPARSCGSGLYLPAQLGYWPGKGVTLLP